MDIPLWLSIVLYLVAGLAIVGVLYLLVLTAVRHAMRAPLAELRTARRRQEDLLREISTSAAYLADVADAWAEGEAERRAGGSSAASSALGVVSGETETPSPWSAEGAALAEAAQPGAVQTGAVEPEVPRDAAGRSVAEPDGRTASIAGAADALPEPETERNHVTEFRDDAERQQDERRDAEPQDEEPGPAVGSSSSRFSA
jgi:hypothetical protein